MFEYPQYADMVGVTVKSMFGAFFTDESTKDFIDVMNKTASTITTLKK